MARVCGFILPFLLVMTLFGIGQHAEAAPAPRLHARDLERQLSSHGWGDFSSLLQSWRKSDSRAKLTVTLLQLAQKEGLSDKSRAIALIAAAELATEAADIRKSKDVASKQLADPRWLVRLYAIKALEKCGAVDQAELLSARLNDPSLMVRAEAAEALYRFALQYRQAGTPLIRERLIRALEFSSNYTGNRPLWVPERALAALGELGGRSELQMLVKRFEDEKKEELLLHAQRALLRTGTAALR